MLLLCLLLCLCPSFASAQVSATLSGIVTDQSGAAVPAATATAQNLDTGLSRETVTDQAGRYQLFALPLGQYEVRVKKTGFAEAVRTGVRLVVGQDAKVDLTLRLGAVSEEVKVNGDAAIVSLTTQDISGLGLWFVESIPWSLRWLRYLAVTVHVVAALATIGGFIIHVYMGTAMVRGGFTSIVRGEVTEEWARSNHRLWYEQVTRGTSAEK